jgi:hypothetical protein
VYSIVNHSKRRLQLKTERWVDMKLSSRLYDLTCTIQQRSLSTGITAKRPHITAHHHAGLWQRRKVLETFPSKI